MICQEMYVAEKIMGGCVKEHLNQSLQRKQARQMRQVESNLPYRLGRLLTRWGEQLTQYGRSQQSLTVGDRASGMP
jgi:hypothetical protein